MNLPAHFMCRPTGEGLEFFIDAHANGKASVLYSLLIFRHLHHRGVEFCYLALSSSVAFLFSIFFGRAVFVETTFSVSIFPVGLADHFPAGC